MIELFLGAILVGAVVSTGIALNRRSARRLRHERRGEGLENFEQAFPREVPRPLIEGVYKYLQSHHGVQGVPIRPTDTLRETIALGKVGGIGLDDAIHDIEEELCIDLPIRETELPLETARDLVLYVHELKRNSENV